MSRLGKELATAALLVLAGCAQADSGLQMFVAGDLANAAAISAAAGDAVGAQCAKALMPVAMASPNPAQDGLLVVEARKRALALALAGGCGQVVAPALLSAIGKVVPQPFNLLLPY